MLEHTWVIFFFVRVPIALNGQAYLTILLYAVWTCCAKICHKPGWITPVPTTVQCQSICQCFPSHLAFIHNPFPDPLTPYDLNLMLSVSLFLHCQIPSAPSWAGRALSRANIYRLLLFNDHYRVTFWVNILFRSAVRAEVKQQ